MHRRRAQHMTIYTLIPPQAPLGTSIRTNFRLSALLTLPLTALLYLLSGLTAAPLLPADFAVWVINRLAGVVRTGGFLLTSAAAVAINVQIDNALLAVGEVATVLLFVLSGGLVGLLSGWLRRTRRGWIGWLLAAGSGLLWGCVLTAISRAGNRDALLLDYALPLALFAGWGALVGWANSHFATLATPQLARRRFLAQLAAGVLAVTLLGGVAGMQLARRRQHGRSALLSRPAFFPVTLIARIYPTTFPFEFPEFEHPRYRPASHPIGVCFSGGGNRSTSAAVGQMRGLRALGLLDRVGAISCVSGGAWFGTLFSYAPPTIPDETLLGAVLEPVAITLEKLAELDPHYIAAPFANFSTERVSAFKTGMMVELARDEVDPPFNRLYSRTLNEFLLKPLALDDPHKFFTLDQVAVDQIIHRNPALRPSDFYTMRPDRPYLIAGAAQAYPLGEAQTVRGVEMTPLYTGIPQAYPGEGANGLDLGGGYVESFAFDSPTPLAMTGDNLVEVMTPNPPFLLSDLLGTTSAAPGALLNTFGQPEWFPKFNYWSPAQPATGNQGGPTPAYSFVDGAALENAGIIPLLRRHYPLIIAFINGEHPIGSTAPATVNGIGIAISSLFGLNASIRGKVEQDTQVFPQAQFQPLADNFKRTRAAGKTPWFVDSYPLIQPNAFDIPPYPADGPGQGKVTVIWFYNDLNEGWRNQLRPEVQQLLASTDPANNLRNFPHYDTFAQNRNALGLPELLNLTPQQINLIAHMWCYTVMQEAQTLLDIVRDL